jgi:tripartite-type tricarboxylate transporter receptor subunit TctC
MSDQPPVSVISRHAIQGALAALVMSAAACFAQSQPYPNKPVRMIVGFTPGSEIDVVARLLNQEMSDNWGQRVVVDNRSGAGGTVAGAIAATAAADGYTLFFNSVSHAASQALYPKLPYDTLRDFAAVSQATSAPNVLIVAPSQGIKSVKELLVATRQKAGQANYGSAGVGSGTHITGEMFRIAAQLNVSHIPYKGVPEVLADTATGRIHYSFAPIGNALPFVKDRRLVGLAVTTAERVPSLPEVPTVSESAIPGFEWDQWYGLFVPAKTPRAIVNQLSKEMARVLALSSIRERLAVRGSVPKPSTPEAFDRFVRAEVEKVTRAIQAGGIKLE